MKIELQYFDGCPHWRTSDERLRAVATERGLSVSHRVVSSEDDAEAIGFAGSPTILINGRDPFARGAQPVGLACRVYETPEGTAGSPTVDQIPAAINGA